MGSETPAQRNGRLLSEAAEIITGWPLLCERLRTAHVPDGRGRCRACTSQTHVAPRWPCALAIVAGARRGIDLPLRRRAGADGGLSDQGPTVAH